MSALAFALMVWADFREVLLLQRFICATIRNNIRALNHDQDLDDGFHTEFKLMQSFGRCYLQDEGKLDPKIVSEPWLHDVGDILARLRQKYEHYAKLACLRDSMYQRYSPFVNISNTPYDALGFSWGLEEPQLEPLGFDLGPNVWMEGFDRLWQPKNLHKLLSQTRLYTERLIGWAPLIMATHPRFRDLLNDPKQKKAFVSSEDAHSLCAAPHILIRDIMLGKSPSKADIVIHGCELEGPVRASALCTGYLVSSDAKVPVLIEYYHLRRTSDPEHPNWGERELLQLAWLLKASSSSSDLHTLSLKGIVNQVEHKRVAFVFEYPNVTGDKNLDFLSLHDIICNKASGNIVPLPTRFQIAQTLAKTLAKLHADGWVHKNIRSHSVIFFRQKGNHDSKPAFNAPYLVNFEYARPIGAQTSYTFDVDLERNVYRHPARQGPPSEAFSKSHDIYALGVVLLEIGLWQTTLEIFRDQNAGVPANEVISPQEIQQKLLEAAVERLPFFMGKSYADAVSTCLSGKYSEESEDLASEVRFVRDIVKKVDVAMLQAVME